MISEFIIDEANKQVIEKITEDVEPVLDENKRLFNLNDGYSPSRELRRVASIPASIQTKWLVELGVDVMNKDHWPAVKRLLNSNEYLYLRTAPGRL